MDIELKSAIGQLDKPNHNGRVYSSDTMKRAIESWKQSGRMYGELGHPEEDFLSNHISRISHEVEDIYIKDNEVYSKIKLYNTPSGKLVQDMINNGVRFRLDPRMTCNVVPIVDGEGNPVLDDEGKPVTEILDVNIISVDLVPDNI